MSPHQRYRSVGASITRADWSEVPPETILPVQFFLRRRATLRPEKRLMLAVLEHAVAEFQRYHHLRNGRARLLFEKVQAWFASDDTTWPFAFVNICDAVGLDAACIRSGLTRWGDGNSGDRHVIARRRDGSSAVRTAALPGPQLFLGRVRHCG